MLIHIALFHFPEHVKSEEINDLLEDIQKLKNDIPTIREVFTGLNCHPKYHEFSHAVVLQFENREGVAFYRDHPAHKPIAARVVQLADRRLGFDLATS